MSPGKQLAWSSTRRVLQTGISSRSAGTGSKSKRSMSDLTPRQRQVLNAITPGISLRELMAKLGIRCPNGIEAHLKPLKRKGYVSWTPGKSRTLVRLDRGIEIMGSIQ